LSGLEIIVALLMLLGLAGTIIPYFPGILLVLGGAGLWALLGDVGLTGWVTLGILVAIGVTGMVLSTLLSVRMAAGGDAPRWILGVGLLGVVVGFFVIPVVGALIGGPIAILLAEFYRVRDLDRAWTLTVRVLKGVGVGILVEFVTAVILIAIWVSVVLFV